jgi:thioredoxin 1
MMSKVVEFTDQNFEQEVLKAQGTVVVDFTAEWCPHCKHLAPVIEQLAEEYTDAVKIGAMNVSENTQTPTKYSVLGIPTVIIFKDGKQADVNVGFAPKAELKAKIDAVAKKG